MDNKTLKEKCMDVIKEWEQIGGFINCYEYHTPIFLEDETVYFDWLKEEKKSDCVENQKEYCKIALELCGVFLPDEIETILWK